MAAAGAVLVLAVLVPSAMGADLGSAFNRHAANIAAVGGRGEPVPAAVLADLAHIDKLLSKLIGDVRDGSLESGAQTIARIAEIEKAKREMVSASFEQPIYGLKFSEVFFGLDCLDARLGHARGAIVGAGGHVKSGVVEDLNQGQKCKQKLENKLRSASPPPSKALSISPIKAVFSEPDRATTYSVPTITDAPGSTHTYQWALTLQAVDPSKPVDHGCNNHGVLGGTATTFVWHHGNRGDAVHDDGCDHTKQGIYGHQGLISVIITDNHGAKCSATYKGTNTSDANSVKNGVASEPKCSKAKP